VVNGTHQRQLHIQIKYSLCSKIWSYDFYNFDQIYIEIY